MSKATVKKECKISLDVIKAFKVKRTFLKVARTAAALRSHA